MKKIIVLVLISVLTFLPLCGCVKEPDVTSDSLDAGGIPGIPGGTQSIALNIWCDIGSDDPLYPALENALKEFKNTYPEITLNVENYDKSVYTLKLKSTLPDDMPDIFSIPSLEILRDYCENGKLYCLDDAYQEFKGELPQQMVKIFSQYGKIYGFPTVCSVVGLYANMDLLKEADYDEVPKTYEELLKCVDALKSNHIIAFGCSGKETDCIAKYFDVIMQKTIGPDKMNDILSGTLTWNDPDIADAVDKFQYLIKCGYFDPSGIGLSDDEIKQNFIDGKYAFYVFDSFRLAEFCDDSVNPGFSRKITFTAFPAINSGKAIESSIVGTSCETFAVYTNSKNKEQAARYAGILTRLICHYAYQYGYGIPAWTPYGDTSSVPSNVQDVTELCRTLYSFSADSKYNMSEYDYQTYLEYVDQIYSGEMNGEAFISGMSKDIR